MEGSGAMLTEKIFYDMSLIAYFDAYELSMSVAQLITRILEDEELAQRKAKDLMFPELMKQLAKIDASEYQHMYIKSFVNDNANSGVVYYVISYGEVNIYAFRGSEALDEVTYTTGWQDWSDNFHMFLPGPTDQQLYASHRLQQEQIDRPFYLCGHSKGGNLALFLALTCSDEMHQQLQGVVSFNAPGITRSVYASYLFRAQDPMFVKKLYLFENENDCISSFFEHLREPIYIKSCMPCTTLMQLYHNHNLYAMDFEENLYVIAEKKTPIPKIVYHFVNDFFVNLKGERLQRIVSHMDDYFTSSLSMSELYKVFLYHISQYTNLFEDISYDEIQTITFQDLVERRKTKNLLGKVVNKASTTLHEVDVKEITQGFIDNYEALIDTTKTQFQELLNRNNNNISDAINSIRNRMQKEEQDGKSN